MSKRTWAVLAAGALFASVLAIGPASAQDAPPAIPAEPNIVDPTGDANFINNSMLSPVPVGNDHSTPADGSGIADIVAGWFTNDATTVTAHIQTEQAPPGGNGLSFNVYAAPGEGPQGANTVGCLRFWIIIPGTNPGGGTYQGAGLAKLHDRCHTGGTASAAPDIEYTMAANEDGTGTISITAPRELSPLFATGSTLGAPTIVSSSPAAGADGVGSLTLWIDNTNPGTDYTVTAGGEAPAPKPDPGPPSDGEVGNDDPNTGGPDNPPVKKGCKKGKGKKKGCKKPKKTAGCAAYQPGEQGAEAETFVVKDEHTAEAPLEITIEQEMGQGGDLGVGVYDGAAHTFRNLQVDAKAAEAGLYIRYEFPVYEDHDLYVNYAGGSEAAHVGGFNMTPVGIFDGTGAGGHSEQGAEQIDGLRTGDCGGYTIDFSNYLGEGGEYTVKVWLGEIQNDPAPPA